MGVVPGPFAVLDFNGDGIPDVAGVRGAGQAYLVLGTATGAAPEQTVALPAAGSLKAVTAADLDADGNDDLAISVDQDAALVVLRGRADGVLTAPAAVDVHAIAAPTPGEPRNTSVTAGDVDGDGDPDVIAAVGSAGDFGTPADTTASGTVTVFVNDGSGGLTATPTPLAVNAPAAMMLVPLAGDGDPDLIVAQRNAPAASSLAVFPGAAGAGFGAGATGAPAAASIARSTSAHTSAYAAAGSAAVPSASGLSAFGSAFQPSSVRNRHAAKLTTLSAEARARTIRRFGNPPFRRPSP
jgi:hypothetical protein